MNLNFLGVSGNNLTESYGAGASDGLMEGVDVEGHIGSDEGSTSITSGTVRLAMLIVIGALVALWFLGAVTFRATLRG